MLRLSATVDIRDADEGLAAMEHVRLAPVFKELGKPLRDDQRDHAKKQEGPEGSWPKRSAHTAARIASARRSARRKKDRTAKKRRLPRKILGRLPTAISMKTSASGVVIESKVAWSGIHQEGGTAGRGARIPARPFLWISERFLDLAAEKLAKAGVRAFLGGR